MPGTEQDRSAHHNGDPKSNSPRQQHEIRGRAGAFAMDYSGRTSSSLRNESYFSNTSERMAASVGFFCAVKETTPRTTELSGRCEARETSMTSNGRSNRVRRRRKSHTWRPHCGLTQRRRQEARNAKKSKSEARQRKANVHEQQRHRMINPSGKLQHNWNTKKRERATNRDSNDSPRGPNRRSPCAWPAGKRGRRARTQAGAR